MNRQISLPSLMKDTTSKTEFRTLRAKVLKILDNNFKKFNPILKPKRDDRLIDISYTLPIKIRHYNPKSPMMNNSSNLTSKNADTTYDIDVRAYNSTETDETLIEDSDLTVKNLAKFLTFEELELVCEDPIYFLGRPEYQDNPQLNSCKEWQKEYELANERKLKEKNWRQAQEANKIRLSQSPRKSYFDKLSQSHLTRITSFAPTAEDRLRIKTNKTEELARSVKEKNEEMEFMAKMKRIEESEFRQRKQEMWLESYTKKRDRINETIQQKSHKIKLLLFEGQQGRNTVQQRFSKWKQEKAEKQELIRMTNEIENFLKHGTANRKKSEGLSDKAERARNRGNFSISKSTKRDTSTDFNASKASSYKIR